MKNLLLTLGHNSSAILIEDGELKWGYETERITGVKSDSRFPQAVLDYASHPSEKFDMVYVSHWAPDGRLQAMSAKHWQPYAFDGTPIRTLTPDRSHHDAHMAAAMCYAGKSFPYNSRGKSVGLVVDGFGTFGEHFSVYDLTGGRMQLIQRTHGYDTSLGLWYQYATAFMGMKMHEDEYKLLGYEVHVTEEQAEKLDAMAQMYASEWREHMLRSPYKSKYDPLYDLNALPNVKDRIWTHLSKVCDSMGVRDPTTLPSRMVLAFYVQAVLEHVVVGFVKDLGCSNLILSGGCFYNVKLNKTLIDEVPGVVCVYPLAGDQGNGLGLYAMDHPEFEFPETMNWGRRELDDVGTVQGLEVVDNEETAFWRVLDKLGEVGYVNLVRGDMEFGPRAMCNTSTIALPLEHVVDKINLANDRNTVMPMAPVVTQGMYMDMFRNWAKVHKSEAHMIVALEWMKPGKYPGVEHEYNWPRKYATGRPQVARRNDVLMQDLLRATGSPLINTSCNFHGKPICLGMESVIETHMLQRRRDPSFSTVVVRQ